MSINYIPLNKRSLSLDYQRLIKILRERENILIIQDLDGVCMGLVNDPLTRVIDPEYIKATKKFEGHFFVLTNGEHIGKRGVNKIIEKSFDDRETIQQEGLYLPGLAGGGVQWQDCYGNVVHPGVSEEELAFLEEVPKLFVNSLSDFFKENKSGFSDREIEEYIEATVLVNKVSPTINLNLFFQVLQDKIEVFAKLQKHVQSLSDRLLKEAEEKGLVDSFFIHYAPNLGRDNRGKEVIQLVDSNSSGTTDFQFMLRGAIKEVGVVVILNHYYYLQTGEYPLGMNFNGRKAPQNKLELLELVKNKFNPELMPIIIGVGDTVTSKTEVIGDKTEFKRGGSDRGFLELIQAIGNEFERENTVVYVDSSGGELKNRQPIKLEKITTQKDGFITEEVRVKESPINSEDKNDPLVLNLVFPGGHQQYIKVFKEAAFDN